MKKSLLMLPIVLIAMAMALTACGGGGSSSSGGGEEGAIEEAIETAATSSDPSKCSEVQTEFFNETETGKTGEAALKTCEKETEEEAGEQAESVTVTDIEIEGEGAAAIVEIEGSPLDGQSLAVAMEKEEGDWKLDGFMGFVKYDPAGIAAAFEEKLGEEEGVTPAAVSCVGEGVAEWSKEEAEALFIEKNQEGFEELYAACTE